MSQTGAAKVLTAIGPVWCHFSRQGETLKLRRIVEGAAYDFDVEDNEIEDEVPLPACKKLVPGQQSYSIDKNPAVWTCILATLQSGAVTPTAKATIKASIPQLIVPLTRLRRYYSSMKVFDKALFENLSRFYRDNPCALESLWNDSRRQFMKYDNPDGWEEGQRKSLPQTKQRVSEINTTTEFASFFCQYGLGETGFQFVRRELNPWNTRLGIFSTKLPATKTGRGGIDLLMRSPEGVPVIGEVKIGDDKNAFFALLQAMTYAVELSTPNQLKRLRTHLPSFGDLCVEKAMVEIAIIKVNPLNDPTLDPVLSLITQLNQRANCVGLSRIRLFQNVGEQWTLH